MLNSATATQSKTQQNSLPWGLSWHLLLTSACLSVAAAITALNSPLLEQWERQTQTFFFEVRGPKEAPDDIIILAIDNESLSQSEYYREDPAQYPFLAPIQQWPWQREAYAIAIERLIGAGAKAVSFDILLTTESAYGNQDDERLVSALETYGDRVTLAMKYEDSQMRQGALLKPTLPLGKFLETGVNTGNINSPIELDGRIHRQGHVYLESLEASMAHLDVSSETAPDWKAILSFAEATLSAANESYPRATGNGIHFLGPTQTFRHIPFWYVLDPDLWENYLQSGAVFEDKIVLVGSTASQHQDFHNAPFAKGTAYPLPIAGVEIAANDLATLRAGTALKTAVPSAIARASLMLVIGGGFITLLSRRQKATRCLLWTALIGGGWVVISYVSFVSFNLILPTAGMTAAFLICGGSYSMMRLASEQLRKKRFRNTLAQYAASPIVQEILSKEEEYQDLLEARQAEVVGTLLGARYQVVSVLGYGGFSETYTATDTQRPGNPICVVKRLKITSDDPDSYHLAHRLFLAEAHTLERLGHHSQIPRLLAHFETQSSFYLVEEMVQGTTLKEELSSRQAKSQAWVMNFLLDILPVVGYVHSHGVIHRDIKPSNLIRRAGDGRLVLIDFGSVKEISNQVADAKDHVTSTIGIGTKGYMPSEQSAGLPQFNSDLYAVGVTAIEALTGVSPFKLDYDDRGEFIWQYRVSNLHPVLGSVISRLVRYDFSNRYESVNDVLSALREIPIMLPDAVIMNDAIVQASQQEAIDDDDRWDEPTGFLPADWVTDSTEKTNKFR